MYMLPEKKVCHLMKNDPAKLPTKEQWHMPKTDVRFKSFQAI